jgi:hypothetical protein
MALGKLGMLELLPRLYGQVKLPTAVFTEVVAQGSERGYSDAFLVQLAIQRGHLSVVEVSDVELPSDIASLPLDSGEKLHEELITEGEGIVRTPYEKIFVLKGDTCDFNWLNGKIEELVKLANEQDAPGIKAKLKEIVPEYQPFDMNNSKSRPTP